MRYRLRTLLILLAVLPPLLAGAWWGWRAFLHQESLGGLVETHPDGTQTMVRFYSDGTMTREKLPP